MSIQAAAAWANGGSLTGRVRHVPPARPAESGQVASFDAGAGPGQPVAGVGPSSVAYQNAGSTGVLGRLAAAPVRAMKPAGARSPCFHHARRGLYLMHMCISAMHLQEGLGMRWVCVQGEEIPLQWKRKRRAERAPCRMPSWWPRRKETWDRSALAVCSLRSVLCGPCPDRTSVQRP
jgi:hypothetical protein